MNRVLLAAIAIAATLHACGDGTRVPAPKATPIHMRWATAEDGGSAIAPDAANSGADDDGGAANTAGSVNDGGPPRDGGVAPCSVAPQLLLGPLLGAVSKSSVTVWIQTDTRARFTVSYWPKGKPEAMQTSPARDVIADKDLTGTVMLSDLEPDATYEYAVNVLAEPSPNCVGDQSATFSFHTLPPDGPGRFRFVTAGDVSSSDVRGFDDIAAVKPDFVLMVGDNVYADGFGETFDAYRMRYQGVWSGAQFEALFSSVAAYRIWDDHELVDNYWNGENDDVYAFARKLYDDYQNSMNPKPLVKGELYYSFNVADAGFFVLDTRSHRSPNKSADGPDKTMLGAQQKQALVDWLAHDDSRIHVILSSVLVSHFGTTGPDSWSGFATERDEILQTIDDLDVKNLMVISGDQHWSAILRDDYGSPSPYSVFEFQTTPLAFAERTKPSKVDDSVIALDDKHRVFGVFDIDTQADPVSVDFTVCVVGKPCSPQMQGAPAHMGGTPKLPYSAHFEGGDHGLRMISPN